MIQAIESLVEKKEIYLSNGGDLATRMEVTAEEINIVKTHKQDIINFLITKENAEEIRKEKEREEVKKSPVSLGYYYGDYYRANSIFSQLIDRQPDWGNMKNPFSPEVMKYVGHSFLDTPSEYVDTEEIVKILATFFGVHLNTKPGEFKKQYPDLEVVMRQYDDMRGKGEYIGDIIFQDFKLLEKYLLIACKPKIERDKEEENKLQEKINEAKQTGEKVRIREYPIECQDPREECNMDIVTEYIDGDGKSTSKVIHTY